MKRFFCFILALLFLVSALAEEERGPMLQTDSRVYEALPLSGIKIGIDPGHQEKANTQREAVAPGSSEMKAKVASGTSGVKTGVPEYVLDLEVSLMLEELLSSLGAQVLMTRYTHDVDISNQQRAIMMNEWGADLVLRIHANGSTNRNAHGIGMYVRKTGDRAEESAALAQKLLDAMALETGAKKDGIFKRDTYTGLNWSTVPSVLVEMGFMTNPEEDEKLNDPEYRMRLVAGMANGIIEYVYEAGLINSES